MRLPKLVNKDGWRRFCYGVREATEEEVGVQVDDDEVDTQENGEFDEQVDLDEIVKLQVETPKLSDEIGFSLSLSIIQQLDQVKNKLISLTLQFFK